MTEANQGLNFKRTLKAILAVLNQKLKVQASILMISLILL